MIRKLNFSPSPVAWQHSTYGSACQNKTSPAPQIFNTRKTTQALNSFQVATQNVELTSQQKADLLDLEGEIFMKQGRYTEALNKFQEALRQKQSEGYAFSNLRVAQSYRNLGAVHYCLGHYDEALRNHESALRMRQSGLGENHILTSDSYENIGVVYRAKGNFEEALNYLNKALEIRRGLTYSAGGVNRSLYLKVANSLYDIGCVYRDLENYQEALKYHREALNIRRTYLIDPNNPLLTESEMAVKEIELKMGLKTF